MPRRLVGAPTLLITLLLVTSLGIEPRYARPESCDVTIIHPTEDSPVGKEVNVDGTFSIPNDQYVWLLARREDFAPLWYPQREARIDSGNHTWNARASIG
jgi:hypothetical protein